MRPLRVTASFAPPIQMLHRPAAGPEENLSSLGAIRGGVEWYRWGSGAGEATSQPPAISYRVRYVRKHVAIVVKLRSIQANQDS